jgi:TMEM175 potassium channel family protein
MSASRSPEPELPAELQIVEPDRLVFFSDAVLAIAITLLVLDLPLPAGHDHDAFMASLVANTPEYLSFLVSFVVIGLHWVHHHGLFRLVARVNGRVTVLNLGWLLLIVITPYTTRLLGEDDLSLIKFGMYASNQALQSAVFAMIGLVLVHRGLLRSGVPAEVGTRSVRDALLAASAFAVSIPLFALVGAWAFACWLIVPFVGARLLSARRRRPRSRPAGTGGP